MKKMDKAMLYCTPSMCRLGRRPSILAFPVGSKKMSCMGLLGGHTNVCLIDVRDQVQESKHWNKPHLELKLSHRFWGQ
jgi:hypothetical protein